MSYQFMTLEEAKGHLREDSTATEVELDILLKIGLASSIIFDYLKGEEPEETSPETTFTTADIWTSRRDQTVVRAATCLVLGDLYERREGTGEGAERFGQQVVYALSPTVQALLHRLRDPALA